LATTAAPDGVILDVVVRGAEGSPSQERLGRIAAMLRDAELAVSETTDRDVRERRQERARRGRRLRYAAGRTYRRTVDPCVTG
jgi:hypothetical protein